MQIEMVLELETNDEDEAVARVRQLEQSFPGIRIVTMKVVYA